MTNMEKLQQIDTRERLRKAAEQERLRKVRQGGTIRRYYTTKLWTKDGKIAPVSPFKPGGKYEVVMADEAKIRIKLLEELSFQQIGIIAGLRARLDKMEGEE